MEAREAVVVVRRRIGSISMIKMIAATLPISLKTVFKAVSNILYVVSAVLIAFAFPFLMIAFLASLVGFIFFLPFSEKAINRWGEHHEYPPAIFSSWQDSDH